MHGGCPSFVGEQQFGTEPHAVLPTFPSRSHKATQTWTHGRSWQCHSGKNRTCTPSMRKLAALVCFVKWLDVYATRCGAVWELFKTYFPRSDSRACGDVCNRAASQKGSLCFRAHSVLRSFLRRIALWLCAKTKLLHSGEASELSAVWWDALDAWILNKCSTPHRSAMTG